MSEATSGFGVILRMNGEDVTEVTGLGGPSLERDDIDVTHMQSPDGWKEFIGGLADGGEVEIDLSFLPGNASQQALIEDMSNRGELAEFEMVWTDEDETPWTFNGFVTSFEPGAEIEGKLEASCTIKVSGKPTFE